MSKFHEKDTEVQSKEIFQVIIHKIRFMYDMCVPYTSKLNSYLFTIEFKEMYCG